MSYTHFGTVRCYDSMTGEGLIAPHDGSGDVHVGRSAVRQAGLGQIAPGQVLGFAIGRNSRRAENLWASWSNR